MQKKNKFRRKSKSWTKKRKADYIVGERTKASHKRLIVEKIKLNEITHAEEK